MFTYINTLNFIFKEVGAVVISSEFQKTVLKSRVKGTSGKNKPEPRLSASCLFLHETKQIS